MPESESARIGRANLWFGLIVVLLLGASVRLAPLIGESFPINDGALFAQMSVDLRENGFFLPRSTTYNGLEIPFGYPPLAFYLTAAISTVSGIGVTDVLRWLPSVFATLSIVGIYLLAGELLRSRWRGLIAAGAYALMTRSYLWLVVGGGVTRALGVLLAVMALHQGVLLMRHHDRRYVIGTALLSGLTVLSHPQAAVFLVVSLCVLWLFHYSVGPSRVSFAQLAVAGVGGLLVATPWIASVVVMHGWQPLLSAGRTGMDLGAGVSQLFGLAFSDGIVFDLMTALGILGILIRIARLQFMIPLWFVLTILIDPRAGTTYATIPLSLSVVPVLGEILQRMVPGPAWGKSLDDTPIPRMVWTHRASAILLALILFVALRTAARTSVDPSVPLYALQPEQAAAMQWARDNTPSSAEFVVVTDLPWERDYVSEWFPVVAQRYSLTTVQGSEWSDLDAFLQRVAQHRQLQRCANVPVACLHDWYERWEAEPGYVFIPKGELSGPSSDGACCAALLETLASSGRLREVYDGPGATIFGAP